MEEKRCYGCMKLKRAGAVCEHCGYDERTADDPHRLPAGTVLREQYLVGRVLGQGGFGITYLGWDMYLDIPVAIKEYFPTGVVMRDTTVTMDVVSCSGDEGARFRNNKERFLREAKMLARFSQVPQIVQVKNFFLANNTAYIVMEYVEGITLKQYVREKGGHLTIDETFAILRPIIEALCKVHKAGLVHRDISPDNIMMLPGGGAKLLDFGAVRDVGAAEVGKDLTKSTEAILKQGYAPIEQYQKRGSLGPWTDVYALCATIYFCLTGEVPPDAPERLLGYEELELEKKIPGLTAEQTAALERGMAMRAEDRTASMDELYRELFAVEETIKHEPPEKKKETKKPQEVKKKPGEKKKAETRTGTKTGPVKEPEKKKKVNIRLLAAAILAVMAVVLVAALVFGGGKNEDVPPAETAGAAARTGDGNTVSGNCGQNLTWVLDRDTGELTISGSGEIYDYDYYGYYNSGLAYAPWRGYRGQITSVTIENGVTVIGSCAFMGCKNLKAVQLPGTLEEIRLSAFDQCALTELTLPDGLQTIGESAFSWNPLKTVTIPDSVRYVGAAAFDCNGQLESVTIGPDTRLSYRQYWKTILFGDGQDVKIVGYKNTMAEDYARIMGWQFDSKGTNVWDAEGQCGDTLFWHLDLDNGFLRISGTGEMWDFNGAWMMEKEHRAEFKDIWNDDWDLPPWEDYRGRIATVSIGQGVTSIGENAFHGCDNWDEVYLSDTVEHLSYQSFCSSKIEELYLPDSVTQIDSFTFNWCGELRSLRLPEGLRKLEDNAISDCENLVELYIGADTIINDEPETPFYNENATPNGGAPANEDLVIYSLPGSDAERFANRAGICFAIGYRGMAAEAEGQCGDNVHWFKSGDMLMLYGSGETWRYNLSQEDIETWAKEPYEAGKAFTSPPDFYEYRREIRRVAILPGVTDLLNGLFNWMENLEEVDFGTVANCYTHFFQCINLREVVLPESMETIGSYMFNDCFGLKKVTILNGSSYIGESLFDDCYNLKEVWFGGRERLDEDLFNVYAFRKLEVTFHVKSGSDAERYAKENGILYEYY